MSKKATATKVMDEKRPEPVVAPPTENRQPTEQEVANLAYQRWLERGCPQDSPEDDWFDAERELRTHRAGS